MGRRCVDKNCSKNCKYAFLEKTTVRSESYLDGHKEDEFDQDAINVYCNNPSLKKKLYIDFVNIIWYNIFVHVVFPILGNPYI